MQYVYNSNYRSVKMFDIYFFDIGMHTASSHLGTWRLRGQDEAKRGGAKMIWLLDGWDVILRYLKTGFSLS